MVKIYDVLNEAKELTKKIKEYRKDADRELLACWIYDTLLITEKLGKLVEELQDRVDLLEEELEGKKF